MKRQFLLLFSAVFLVILSGFAVTSDDNYFASPRARLGVENKADLRAFVPIHGQALDLMGNLAINDQPFQTYWYNSTSMAVDDNENVIRPDAIAVGDPGRYLKATRIQIPADWNESSPTALGYIANKPTIPSANVYNAGFGLTKSGSEPNATFAINSTDIMTAQRAADSIASINGKLNGKVPTSRTLTIAGTTFDLSANRTWSPTTSNISEGSNLYYTNTRARSAVSLTTTGTSGAATYNSSTGILNIPNYASTAVSAVNNGVSRTINSTAFRPSTTASSLVNYTVQISTTLSLTNGQTGTVFLETSSDGSTGWVEIGRFTNGNTGTLAVGLNLTQTVNGQLTGYVQPGYYLRLRQTGSGTISYITGQEIIY